MSKLYTAIHKRKNGRIDFSYGVEDDLGRMARNLAENGVITEYDIAELEIKVKGIIPSNTTDYWEED